MKKDEVGTWYGELVRLEADVAPLRWIPVSYINKPMPSQLVMFYYIDGKGTNLITPVKDLTGLDRIIYDVPEDIE